MAHTLAKVAIQYRLLLLNPFCAALPGRSLHELLRLLLLQADTVFGMAHELLRVAVHMLQDGTFQLPAFRDETGNL